METAYLPMFSNMPAPTLETESRLPRLGESIRRCRRHHRFRKVLRTSSQSTTEEYAAQGWLFIDFISYPFILDLTR